MQWLYPAGAWALLSLAVITALYLLKRQSVQKTAPTNAVIALPGVAGLNAVEHLRSVCPACAIIWCSDLDFSLQAFRLRVEYFILEPVSAESFQQGLNVWFTNKEFYANDPTK